MRLCKQVQYEQVSQTSALTFFLRMPEMCQWSQTWQRRPLKAKAHILRTRLRKDIIEHKICPGKQQPACVTTCDVAE